MVNRSIKKILKKRHFWRTINFNQLSEIYVTQLLRSFATGMVGIFVPIYLYKIGYLIPQICFMFLIWFAIRPVWAYCSARIIARLGPKHGMAIGVMGQVVYLFFVLTIETMHWPLWWLGVIGSFCYGIYMMAFFIDFSKIKHTEHGGKELGFLQIFERAGAVMGPLIGGLLATFVNPKFTIVLAIIILCGSLIPLFMSAEPTKIHQIITIKGFPWRRHRRDMFVNGAFALENVVSLNIWPLFLGAFVIIANTYAVLGTLTAISTFLSFFVIYTIGRLIDKSRGKVLLDTGAYSNAVLHLFRPFVSSISQAFAVNLANEPITAMYRMPFLKGFFDASDSVPGYRITYFMIADFFVAGANVIFWALLFMISININGKFALQVSFVIAAIMSIVVTRQRFTALTRRV